VSLSGVHKVCAVWRYDKRAVNGQAAPVVYFATKLEALPPLEEGAAAVGVGEEEEARAASDAAAQAAREALAVATYVGGCLDAVGCRDGPAHTEVKWPRTQAAPAGGGRLEAAGPAIVEVNARWHAANTHPLVAACLGPAAASAVDATALAVLAAKAHATRATTAPAAKTAVGGDGSEARLEAAAARWHALPARCVRVLCFCDSRQRQRCYGRAGRTSFAFASLLLGTAPCSSTAALCTSSASSLVGAEGGGLLPPQILASWLLWLG
jgi:hypothetical protein